MKYLLDTDICIFIINRKPTKVLARLAKCKPGDVAVSSITVAELRFGVAKSQAVETNTRALDQFLTPLEILHFDEEATSHYGEIRANLEKMGKPIGPLDTLIASQAVSAGLTLVTNNVNEFNRVKGLKIENWNR